jgi:hypothetical protein
MYDFPQNVLDLIKEQLAFSGRIGASMARVTPVVALGQPSVVRFTQPGYVLAMYGQTDAGTPASYADVVMRLLINGDQDFFVDGLGGPAFAGFLGLFGGSSNWFPIMRRVVQGDQWAFFFQSQSGGTPIPQVTLAMLNDLDVARMKERAAK